MGTESFPPRITPSDERAFIDKLREKQLKTREPLGPLSALEESYWAGFDKGYAKGTTDGLAVARQKILRAGLLTRLRFAFGVSLF
jgi:hypothetical protein